MKIDKPCPECGGGLAFYDSYEFHSPGDYLMDGFWHFGLGIAVMSVGFICTRWSEWLGIAVMLVGTFFIYPSLFPDKTVWRCEVCHQKYMGKELKPLAKY